MTYVSNRFTMNKLFIEIQLQMVLFTSYSPKPLQSSYGEHCCCQLWEPNPLPWDHKSNALPTEVYYNHLCTFLITTLMYVQQYCIYYNLCCIPVKAAGCAPWVNPHRDNYHRVHLLVNSSIRPWAQLKAWGLELCGSLWTSWAVELQDRRIKDNRIRGVDRIELTKSLL